MHRIYVDQPLSAHRDVVLDRHRSHYVARVLRLQQGAPLVVFDGNGGEYGARVTRVSRHGVSISTGDFVPVERESPLPVSLAIGVSRGGRMHFALQKGVELGVRAFVPLITERTLVHLTGRRRAERHLHWQHVILSACEQCGRTRIPVLSPLAAYRDWCDSATEHGAKLMLDPTAERGIEPLRDVAAGLTLLVGPEGGLSDAERRMARDKGFRPVRLGPRTLRTETAAMVGLAALQLRWGDLA